MRRFRSCAASRPSGRHGSPRRPRRGRRAGGAARAATAAPPEGTPTAPTELSVEEAGRLLRRRRLSSEELTRAYLDRIARHQPRLNAFVTLTEEAALRDARRADRAPRVGRDRGPWHGIPIGHKDLFLPPG